jgi:hypothetical protein
MLYRAPTPQVFAAMRSQWIPTGQPGRRMPDDFRARG